MAYDPNKHHRRSTGLKGYDYTSAGAYFITICTFQRECLFGEIVHGEMKLNDFGQVAMDCWQAIPDHFDRVILDAFVIMPNHIHGILVIPDDGRGIALQCPYKFTQHHNKSTFGKMVQGSIPTIVRSFKSATTKQINILRNAIGTPVWQRNYYDHIIRDEASLNHIRRYVQTNPAVWQGDQLHPVNLSNGDTQRR
jgi:putative transposase